MRRLEFCWVSEWQGLKPVTLPTLHRDWWAEDCLTWLSGRVRAKWKLASHSESSSWCRAGTSCNSMAACTGNFLDIRNLDMVTLTGTSWISTCTKETILNVLEKKAKKAKTSQILCGPLYTFHLKQTFHKWQTFQQYNGCVFSLGEAYGKEGLLSKCAESFQEAEQIYSHVPGEQHAFYTEVFRPLYNKYVNIASAVIQLRKVSFNLKLRSKKKIFFSFLNKRNLSLQ